jgi:sarcosine oxidase subunit alpha
LDRITKHPILHFEKGRKVEFDFEGQKVLGYEGEPIAAALHAAGIRVLSKSINLGRPRGLFCAIGNCASCLMRVDGVSNVRACVEPLREGIKVERQQGRETPRLAKTASPVVSGERGKPSTEIAVVGGGPAGLMAALAAAKQGASVVLLDREKRLGGQLIKQTHKFFGSQEQRAGSRGMDIATELAQELGSLPQVDIWDNCTVLGYYPGGVLMVEKEDRVVGLKADKVIIATGAFEKNLVFPNNDLPGIYGAGAVQTLMNVEGIIPGKRVIMVGAGNIGLIVSYQLLQAGVEVAAIVEAAPKIGGYAVHASKVRRAGVPIYTNHTIKAAYGTESLEGAAIWQLDEAWEPIPGTERYLRADIMCMAVGLSPLAELLWQANCRMKYVAELGGYVPLTDGCTRTTVAGIYVAGDAGGVEEASSAMLSGRLAGLTAAYDMGYERDYGDLKEDTLKQLRALRSGPSGQKIRSGLAKLHEKEGAAGA